MYHVNVLSLNQQNKTDCSQPYCENMFLTVIQLIEERTVRSSEHVLFEVWRLRSGESDLTILQTRIVIRSFSK